MIAYRAKVSLDRKAWEEVRLVSLGDESGFGFATTDGRVVAKAETMMAATELLLQRFPPALEIDCTPYWQQSA